MKPFSTFNYLQLVQKKGTEKSKKDYNLPEPQSQREWDSMISKMGDCGIEKMKAIEIIREIKLKFDKACKEIST